LLNIIFGTTWLPITSGTYTVIGRGYPGINQVGIGVAFGSSNSTGHNGASFTATGGNGSNQTVSVTVSPTGKISVSGSNIMMVNDTLASDSTLLNFNISQTN